MSQRDVAEGGEKDGGEGKAYKGADDEVHDGAGHVVPVREVEVVPDHEVRVLRHESLRPQQARRGVQLAEQVEHVPRGRDAEARDDERPEAGRDAASQGKRLAPEGRKARFGFF